MELYRREVEQGRDPQVREFARTTLETLQQHLQAAQKLFARLEPGRGNPYAAIGAARGRGGDDDRREELQEARQEIWRRCRSCSAGACVALTDIVVDGQANRAHYGRDSVTASRIIQGQVESLHSNVLGKVLRA